MKTHEAALCIECDEIYVPEDHNWGKTTCPCCQNRTSVPISRYIESMKMCEREQEKKGKRAA